MLQPPAPGWKLLQAAAQVTSDPAALAYLISQMNALLSQQETVERLESILAHTPVGIATFDREMRYLSANPSWLLDHKLEHSRWCGRRVYEVIPDLPERWREVHRRALAGEKLEEEAERFQLADGTTRLVRWKIGPWRDTQDKIGGVVLLSENITHRLLPKQPLSVSAIG
jgi:PAS domain S-box-containing protein